MKMDDLDIAAVKEDLGFLIEQKDDRKLVNILLSMHPSDIADLIERFDDRELRLYLFNLLEPEVASDVVLELDDIVREQLVGNLKRERITDLFDEMDSDDAADFVAELEEEVAEEVLEHAEEEGAEEARRLLKHEEDTAGGLMALEIVSVREDSTVDEAIEKIRRAADEVEELYNVYVVDKDNRLVGIAPLKKLLLSRGETPVSEIMDRDVRAVPANMDQEEVANFARHYDLVAIPVVDLEGRLLGRITIDDIVDVMEEEATEDIHHMAGLTDEEELRETSVLRIARVRLPWLVTALFGGMISAIVLSSYSENLKTVIALAFFVPVITATGGNVGIQSSAVVVRGLATGEIIYKDMFRRLFKELKISVVSGLLLGSIIYLVVRLGWHEQDKIALLIGTAMISVIFTASVLGTAIPLILQRMGIDPAVAMGPFITTANDILGLFIYLNLATLFLGNY